MRRKNKRGCTISSGRLLGLYLTTFSKGVLGLEASVELSKNILPTDRQTDRQTDQQTLVFIEAPCRSLKMLNNVVPKQNLSGKLFQFWRIFFTFWINFFKISQKQVIFSNFWSIPITHINYMPNVEKTCFGA